VAERRVLLVLAGSTGGIGGHVRSLADGLRARGLAVTVAGPPATLALFGLPGSVALEVGDRPSPGRSARLVRRLRDLAAHADVVHAHGLKAGALAALAVRGRPLVVTWHNALLATGPSALPGRVLERLVARRADVSLAVSADLVAHLRRLGADDVRAAQVAAPPLPAPSGRAVLDTGGRPLVLAVGRLHSQKGLDVLLAAVPALGPVLVAVAGDGPERPALEAAAAGLPVRLLGRVGPQDLADLLAAAAVVVLPSRWEGRPLAVMEALRAGRPLVATAVGGVPDLVGDGALLVPPGEPAALAVAVRRLIDQPDEAAALAARGRAVAAGWPDEASAVEQVAAVYEELLR
jgi:glycosyltransferase involved in cell wall biosynthesis